MSTTAYTPIQAKIEAARCLMCADAPCVCGCPSGVDPRAFIRKIRFDNLDGAVRAIKSANVLAGSCSFICPTGVMCAKGCSIKGLSRPIDISGLQRFVMDWERKVGMIEPIKPEQTGKKVAVVGSGPAGLGAAAELALRGHIVTIFEKDSMHGGMLKQCIPSFRLPDETVDFEIEFLKKLGIEFVMGHAVENPQTLLGDGFSAVFVATGLDTSRGMDVIGEKLPGVYPALDFLKLAKRGQLPDIGKRAIIIGGGDTAMDAAHVAKHAGAEVFVLYRRTNMEMPAYPDEIRSAWSEGVEFYFRTIVRSIVGAEKVKGVRCVRIKWHESKMPGIQRGYDVDGQEFLIACDTVVVATGQCPSTIFGLRATPDGLLAIDKEKMTTSAPGIFAGGDVTQGGGTAARAVGHGKQAAIKIDEYLKSKKDEG